jgi:hypothetical protein
MHYKLNGFYETGGNYKGRVHEKAKKIEAINKGGRGMKLMPSKAWNLRTQARLTALDSSQIYTQIQII